MIWDALYITTITLLNPNALNVVCGFLRSSFKIFKYWGINIQTLFSFNFYFFSNVWLFPLFWATLKSLNTFYVFSSSFARSFAAYFLNFCISLLFNRGVFRGAMGAQPPWTVEIYGFQGVLRPQRVLSPPPVKKKMLSPPWQNSWIRPCFLNIPFSILSLLFLPLWYNLCVLYAFPPLFNLI